MPQPSKQIWRVKVYLNGREKRSEHGRIVQVTSWTYMIATQREQVGTAQFHDGSNYPIYHYSGRFTKEGETWPLSSIDAFVAMHQVTFIRKFKRYERYVNGPLHTHQSDEF